MNRHYRPGLAPLAYRRAVETHDRHRIQQNFRTGQRYTYGDSGVISVPAGFRRHLVGKTLIYVFHCDSAEIRFVGKTVIIQTFS